MPLYYLTVVLVREIHAAVLKQDGGRDGIRDARLLEGALARPRAVFGDVPLYPTLLDKASALLESLGMNHPFFDKNQRVAWTATKLFLRFNGWTIAAGEDDAVEFMLGVAAGKLKQEHIRAWLERRIRPYGRRR